MTNRSREFTNWWRNDLTGVESPLVDGAGWMRETYRGRDSTGWWSWMDERPTGVESPLVGGNG